MKVSFCFDILQFWWNFLMYTLYIFQDYLYTASNKSKTPKQDRFSVRKASFEHFFSLERDWFRSFTGVWALVFGGLSVFKGLRYILGKYLSLIRLSYFELGSQRVGTREVRSDLKSKILLLLSATWSIKKS